MGSFVSNIQIHNSMQMNRNPFAELFCKHMKLQSLVKTTEEDAEISYALAFSDSNKWVTVTSYEYGSDPAFFKSDTLILIPVSLPITGSSQPANTNIGF